MVSSANFRSLTEGSLDVQSLVCAVTTAHSERSSFCAQSRSEGDFTLGRFGGLCRPPPLCCPTGLGRDVPLRLEGL